MADNSLNELREMEKLTKSIAKTYADLGKEHDGRNKKLVEETKLQADILASIKDEATAKKAINQLQQRYNALKNVEFGHFKKAKQIIQQINDSARTQIQQELRRQAILGKVSKIVDELKDKFSGITETIKHGLGEIPLIGKYVSKIVPEEKINKSINIVSKGFTNGFSKSFRASQAAGQSMTRSIFGGISGGASGAATAIARIGASLGPIGIAIAAIVAVLGIGIYRFAKVEEAAHKVRKETGLLNSQTKGLEAQISAVAAKTAYLGVEMDDVADAAAEFYKEFKNIEAPSTEVLAHMVALNKNFGIALSDAAKLNKLFQNMGGLTQEQAEGQISIATNLARSAGVAPSQVIKDMADNAEQAYRYFWGSFQELTKASVMAAKLGTSISDLTKTADTLLEFESSITAELQASAILGRRFDLTQARSAAAAGDIFAMNNAIVDELNKMGDITELNRWKQDALVKATGKQFSELVNMQRIQKQFGPMAEHQVAKAMELAKAGKDISKYSKEDLDHMLEHDAHLEEQQTKMEQMHDAFKSVGSTLMDAFLPIGEIAVSILVPAFKLIASFVKGFVTPFANMFKRIGEQLKTVFSIFGGTEGIMSYLMTGFDYLGRIVAVFGTTFLRAFEMGWNAFQSILDVAAGLVKVVKGLFTGDMQMIGKGLGDIFKGVLGFFLAIPKMIINVAMDAFPELLSWLGSSIAGLFTNMLPDWALSLLGMKSEPAKAQEAAASPGGSVNDGVIQNGKIISTNPADTLIASKSPGELFQKAMEMTPMGMIANGIGNLLSGGGGNANTSTNYNELIAELRGLRADMASGKIAVNMDGRKITSGVSKVSSQSSGNSYVQK